MLNLNNRNPLKNFLVATGDQALYNTAGSGNNISNTSTGAIRLASGQLGIFSATDRSTVAPNVATDATPTRAEALNIYIAQGTADSASPSLTSYAYPLVSRPYERSGVIYGWEPVIATKQVYEAPTSSIWVVGNTSTGAIAPANNTSYGLTIAYSGRIQNEMVGSTSVASYTPEYVTPNYTTLATVNPLDHLIQNLVYTIDINSQAIVTDRGRGAQPIVAFALDRAGLVGTAVSGLAAGYLPLITTTAGTRGIYLTAGQATNLIAALPVGSSIVTVDLTTAGTATGADSIAIMALDRRLAFDDRIPQVKIKLDVGLRYGFANSVFLDETSYAFEGQGVARNLDLEYKRTAQQLKYNLNHDENPIPNYPSPISTSATYTRYNIEHYSSEQNDMGTTTKAPQTCVILVPSGSSTTIGQLDTALDSWLESVGSNLATI